LTGKKALNPLSEKGLACEDKYAPSTHNSFF
jgi:hypothetical protein